MAVVTEIEPKAQRDATVTVPPPSEVTVSAASPALLHYEDRVKASLAVLVIFVFAGLLLLWTWIPPKLPGEVVGNVVGAFLVIIGGIGQFYWQSRKQS